MMNKGNGSTDNILTKFNSENNLVTNLSDTIITPIIKDGRFKKLAQFVGTATNAYDNGTLTSSKTTISSVNWEDCSEFLLVLSTTATATRILASSTIPRQVAWDTRGTVNSSGTHQCIYMPKNGPSSVAYHESGVDFLTNHRVNLYCSDKSMRAELWGKY